MQWTSWDNELHRYQGSVIDHGKELVQKTNAGTAGADWAGIVRVGTVAQPSTDLRETMGHQRSVAAVL